MRENIGILKEFLNNYNNDTLEECNIDIICIHELYEVYKLFTPFEVKILLTAIYCVNCKMEDFCLSTEDLIGYIYETTEVFLRETEDDDELADMYEEMFAYIRKGKEKCPVCEDGELVYHKVNDTHIWVCDTCPIIRFEYYEEKNLLDLISYLRRDK